MAFDFKSIKSLFVLEEETSGSGKEAPKSTSKGVQQKAGMQKTPAPQGKVTTKFIDILFGALEKNNLPGVDYLEYKQSLQSLEKMSMEEKVRYQSAFAMAQAMGATPQKLIETASHYLDVLKGEQAKFGEAVAKQENSKIEGRKKKIDQYQNAIQQKTEQIKKLTVEVNKHKEDMAKLENEIKSASANLATTKSNFSSSYNALVGQIMKDVENMKKYLK